MPIVLWAIPDTFAPTHVGADVGQSPLFWQRKSPFGQVLPQDVATFVSTTAVGGHVGWTAAFGSQQNRLLQSEPRVHPQHGSLLQFTGQLFVKHCPVLGQQSEPLPQPKHAGLVAKLASHPASIGATSPVTSCVAWSCAASLPPSVVV
jgi:hypothetical protein